MPSMVLCAFTYMIKFNPLNSVRLVVSKPFLHEEKKKIIYNHSTIFLRLKYLVNDKVLISMDILRLHWQCPSH